MDKIIVSDEIRRQIYNLLEDLKWRLFGGKPDWEFAKPRLVAVAEGRDYVPGMEQKPPEKKRDLAEEARHWFELWYRQLSLAIKVPKPYVSNREFARREKAGQALFYRPATRDISYEAFMIAVQGKHWTVTDAKAHAEIAWEPIDTGYWFWAEVQDDCPRCGICWNDLSASIHLLALEEYVIVWHAHKAEAGKMLDRSRSIWCWLRTRFRQGVVRASEDGGEVEVRSDIPEGLAIPFDFIGGRAMEVVKNAA